MKQENYTSLTNLLYLHIFILDKMFYLLCKTFNAQLR